MNVNTLAIPNCNIRTAQIITPSYNGDASTAGCGHSPVPTSFVVSYELNGHGDAISAVSGATTIPSILPVPTASGYVFGGWYIDTGLTTSAVAGSSISANTTLYAKWTAEETETFIIFTKGSTYNEGAGRIASSASWTGTACSSVIDNSDGKISKIVIAAGLAVNMVVKIYYGSEDGQETNLTKLSTIYANGKTKEQAIISDYKTLVVMMSSGNVTTTDVETKLAEGTTDLTNSVSYLR